MRKHFAMATASAVILTCFGASAFADTDLRARLRGLNEVPPTTSRATASLVAEINADETAITFTLSFENLTANPVQAHIHFGPTKVNGGVMVFFCGGGGQPACPATTTGSVSGTITAANVVGPTAQGVTAGDFADVVRAIKTGNGYANIHNANFPAGEVRGQVIAFGGDHDADD